MTYGRNFVDFLPVSYHLPTRFVPHSVLLRSCFDAMERRGKVGNVDKVAAEKECKRKMKEKRAFISFFQNNSLALRHTPHVGII